MWIPEKNVWGINTSLLGKTTLWKNTVVCMDNSYQYFSILIKHSLSRWITYFYYKVDTYRTYT